MKKQLKNKTAFSMVEMSIVIIIVGVLIAMVATNTKIYSSYKLQGARQLTQSSPVAVIEDLVMWFETTSDKSFSYDDSNNNASVNNWYDINPQVRTIERYTATGTSTARPTYISNCRNNLPCLRFDGNDQLIMSPEGTYSQYLSIFMVATPHTGTDSYIIGSNDGASAPSFLSKYTNGSVRDYEWYLQSERQIIYTTAPSGLNILEVFRDNAGGTGSLKGYFNGTQVFNTTATVGITSLSLNYIGSAGSVGYYRGDIAELIIFNRILTTAERDAIEDYLGKKWGITVN